MKWKNGRRDGNIEDRRQQRGPRNPRGTQNDVLVGDLVGGRPPMRGEEALRERYRQTEPKKKRT